MKKNSPFSITIAGAISLIIVMGLGRFSFTALLPMMLHDRVIDLQGASLLATVHYIGYFLGAFACMIAPWLLRRFQCKIPSHAAIVRYSVAATALLVLAMSLFLPILWPWFRFLAGVTCSLAFVYTSGWCLERLSQLKAVSLSGIIYTGPGIGIIISGVNSMAMMALHVSAAITWLSLGLLGIVLTTLIWNIIQDSHDPTGLGLQVLNPLTPSSDSWTLEQFLLTLAYGFAGFGYIITATFLPVIAKEMIPNSLWINFFWPLFGISVVIGALLVKKIPVTMDRRSLLVGTYLMQSLGVFMVLWFPNQKGFVLGSILVGIPFNMISLFGMQEARRLRPLNPTLLMGFITAAYGIGQILGPMVVTYCLGHTTHPTEGFKISLAIAASILFIGALLHLLMKFKFQANHSE